MAVDVAFWFHFLYRGAGGGAVVMELIQKCWVLVTITLVVGEMVTAQDGSQSPVQVEDHKPAATDTNQKEYIETSQFRRNFPLNNLMVTKTSTSTIKKEVPTAKKQIKLKNTFVQLSEKKSFKQAQEEKLVTTSRKEDKHETIIVDPPAPYQLPFNDEIFLSLRALPTNEEYDRNSQYQHSFLYGYERF